VTRIRMILLSLLSVFAVSAVASASASAVVFECGKTEGHVEEGGDVALCKGTPYVEVGSPSEHAPVPFTSKKTAATTSKLEVTGGPTIVCTAATNTGEFDISNGNIKDETGKSPDASDVYITFTVCKITNTLETEAKCSVNSPGRADGTIIVSGGKTGRIPPETSPDDGLDGILTGAGSANPVPIQFAPSATGEPFVVIEIGNKNGECPFTPGKFNVTGKQKGKTENGIVKSCESAVVHKLVFPPTESELKFGSKEAKFELTEDVELTSKEVWGLCPS
jgi:hypothetical protein